ALGLAFAAGAGDVAQAVAVGAQEGAAALDAFGDAGFLRVPAGNGAARVALRAFFVVLGLVIVRAPFPHVAHHVDEAVAVGGIRAHGGGGQIAVKQLIV